MRAFIGQRKEEMTPLYRVTKTPLWPWYEPMKQGYSTVTDRHGGGSNMCEDGASVKPTALTHKGGQRATKKKDHCLFSSAESGLLIYYSFIRTEKYAGYGILTGT